MTKGLTFYKKEIDDTTYRLQLHQKRPMCPSCDNTFIALASFTHPFMFTRVVSPCSPTLFTIKSTSDAVVSTLSNDLVKIINAGDIDYIYCNLAPLELDDVLDCGYYYYELTCEDEIYYSEMWNNLNLELDISSTDICVNGQFTTDLTGWSTTGTVGQITTGGTGAADLTPVSTLSQTPSGYGVLKIIINTLSTYTQGMYFSYGQYTFDLLVGTNVFYIPSGVEYTIENNDTVDANDLIVNYVEIYQLQGVACYNLLMARNSCNKADIPYIQTGYTDVFVLDGELSEPEYLRNDEQVEDYRKDIENSFLKISKKFNLTLSKALFEPLVDELHKIPANDIIYLFNDIWKREFNTENSLQIDVNSEYPFENKCDSQVVIEITETLISINSCCETIEDLAECCTEFEYDLDPLEDDVFTLTVTVPCTQLGVYYYIDRYNDADVLQSSTLFDTSIDYDTSIAIDQTYKVRASKFGCEDIEYTLLVS